MKAMQKAEYHLIELLRALERGEVGDTFEQNQPGVGDRPGEVFCMFCADELVGTALRDGDRYVDLSEIVFGVVWLGPLHE